MQRLTPISVGWPVQLLFSILFLCVVACDGSAAPTDTAREAVVTEAVDDAPSTPEAAADSLAEDVIAAAVESGSEDQPPMPYSFIWQPWHGDFDGMVERRVIRALVPFGGYQFYYEDGRPRGASYDLLQRLEEYVNKEAGRKNIKIYVVAIPMNRDELVPALLEGHADLIAADLTITPERSQLVTFARPMLTKVNEVIVTGPGAAPLESLDDLSGKRIVVRQSSSYFEHLGNLSKDFESRELEPPVIQLADEILEAEDLLEMVNGGVIRATVMDDYKARFWAGVFPNINVREDLKINEGGSIAWAMRNDSPLLEASIAGFLRKYGKGTMIGNDTYNRYLSNASRVRCSHTRRALGDMRELTDLFKKYAEQFGFDWLMLAAQGYQESGLRQDRVSHAGAVGLMQIKPSTAADKHVGINDVTTVDNNVHAAAKYMRFIADRYYGDDEFSTLNQWIFSLAAYNAGPAKINRYRKEASKQGYDPYRWFDNVEIIAARRIGRETVTYVSNIFKYFVGYQLTLERGAIREDLYGDDLEECVAGSMS
jgi:membrane-bound lytic murein transglycosylase MltF